MQNLHKPKNFRDFIGQHKLKKILKFMIKSSLNRKTNLDHILLYGRQGYGKTTLANVIANELNANIRFAQGPMLEKKSDILTLLSSISENDVVFIDEIHAINKNIEELLYSAIEYNIVDIPFGPEGETKIIRMKLPKFTLIGSTTKLERISKPLRDRFGLVKKMDNYSIEEIEKIIFKNAKSYKIDIDEKGANMIAQNSQLNPRISINIFKRTFDYVISLDKNEINKSVVTKTFKLIGIYLNGLRDYHIEYLQTLNLSRDRKSLSLDAISGILNESRNSVEQMIEPLLIKLNYIQVTSKGRRITPDGRKYLLLVSN